MRLVFAGERDVRLDLEVDGQFSPACTGGKQFDAEQYGGLCAACDLGQVLYGYGVWDMSTIQW